METQMTHRNENTSVVSRLFIVLAAMLCLTNWSCSTAPKNEAGKENLHEDADMALRTMKDQDPSLDNFLKNAHAYAIFPSVSKGGLIAGGAYGRGEVYQGGQMIGYADLSQATIGAQAGGQEFSELIVFESAEALD